MRSKLESSTKAMLTHHNKGVPASKAAVVAGKGRCHSFERRASLPGSCSSHTHRSPCSQIKLHCLTSLDQAGTSLKLVSAHGLPTEAFPDHECVDNISMLSQLA